MPSAQLRRCLAERQGAPCARLHDKGSVAELKPSICPAGSGRPARPTSCRTLLHQSSCSPAIFAVTSTAGSDSSSGYNHTVSMRFKYTNRTLFEQAKLFIKTDYIGGTFKVLFLSELALSLPFSSWGAIRHISMVPSCKFGRPFYLHCKQNKIILEGKHCNRDIL